MDQMRRTVLLSGIWLQEWRAIAQVRTSRLLVGARRYHSLLKTVAGCTRAARHAGIRHAVVATPNRSPMTPANTEGSRDLVAYKLERISCATAMASSEPAAAPPSAGARPSSSIRSRTCSHCAPSASRIPISVRRCVTKYASTPNRPTAASNSDMPAKAASNVASKFASSDDLLTI